MSNDDKSMNMLTFYSEILSLGNMVVNEDGFVSLKAGDKYLPVSLKLGEKQDSKRLVLPTSQNLLQSNDGNYVFFHPLRENLVRGESEVISFFRKAVNIKVITVATTLMEQILTLATSTELHRKLTADQTSLMSVVSDADEKTIEFWEKIKPKVSYENSKSRLFSIYLRKHGKSKGISYFCLGVVTFPFFESLEKCIESNSKEFLGVKCRKKDLEILKNLIGVIIPDINSEDTERYRIGSNDKHASFLVALLKSVNNIVSPLNELTDLLFKGRSPLPKTEKDELYQMLYFPMEWTSILDNFHVIEKEILMVPPQKWNEGRPIKKSDKDSRPEEVVEDTSVVSNVPTPRRFETITTPVTTNVQPTYNPFNVPTEKHNNFGTTSSKPSGRTIVDLLGTQPQQQYPQYQNNPYVNQNPFNNSGVNRRASFNDSTSAYDNGYFNTPPF